MVTTEGEAGEGEGASAWVTVRADGPEEEHVDKEEVVIDEEINESDSEESLSESGEDEEFPVANPVELVGKLEAFCGGEESMIRFLALAGAPHYRKAAEKAMLPHEGLAIESTLLQNLPEQQVVEVLQLFRIKPFKLKRAGLCRLAETAKAAKQAAKEARRERRRLAHRPPPPPRPPVFTAGEHHHPPPPPPPPFAPPPFAPHPFGHPRGRGRGGRGRLGRGNGRGRFHHSRGGVFAGRPRSKPSKNKMAARFVQHITIPDNSEVKCNEAFVKVWEVRNDAQHAWPSEACIKAIGGDDFNVCIAPLHQPLQPGETGQVSASLRAPSQPGLFQGFFRLEGTGGRIGQRLWCKIITK